MARSPSTRPAPASGDRGSARHRTGGAMVAGCALKTPPDAAALKEQALPDAADAGAVDGGRRWRRRRLRQLARHVRRRCSWPRRSPKPSLTTPTCAWAPRGSSRRMLHAKLAGAKLYPSVDLLARGGGKLSGDGSGLRAASSPRTGRSISGAACATAGRQAPRKPRRREADFEYARQSIAALVAKSWFLATEAGLQIRGGARDHSCERGARPAGRRPGAHRGRQSRGCVRGARRRRRPIATSCASSSWDASRRFERSSSCSAGTPRPPRSPRRSCRVSPARSRRGCHRSFWSADRT